MTDEELTAAIREVRERVLQRNTSELSLPDLMPLVHARDAAEAKVAAIGTVNPRGPGLKSSVIQWCKRKVARALAWHVREQVEFNRAAMNAVQATLEALVESNRALTGLGKVQHTEQRDIYTLRAISELHASFQQRVADLEKNFRDLATRQHDDFAAQLKANTQQLRTELETLIHHELRLVRQRAALEPVMAAATPPPASTLHVDPLRFAEHFRGPEAKVREHQRRYLEQFHGAADILDVGCGRGEFLEAAREAGLHAFGIDASAEFVALCRSKNLDVQQADLFAHLSGLAPGSLGGAFCSHVVEHLDPLRVPDLIALLGRALRRGAPLVMETPNPEALTIFATHFYLDPTHTRPVPAALLTFYLQEAGFSSIQTEHLGVYKLDYALAARKL